MNKKHEEIYRRIKDFDKIKNKDQQLIKDYIIDTFEMVTYLRYNCIEVCEICEHVVDCKKIVDLFDRIYCKSLCVECDISYLCDFINVCSTKLRVVQDKYADVAQR